MISFREALRKANNYHTHLFAVHCTELEDSWIFTMGRYDYVIPYGPRPLRVMKEDGYIYEWNCLTKKAAEEYKTKYVRGFDIKKSHILSFCRKMKILFFY